MTPAVPSLRDRRENGEALLFIALFGLVLAPVLHQLGGHGFASGFERAAGHDASVAHQHHDAEAEAPADQLSPAAHRHVGFSLEHFGVASLEQTALASIELPAVQWGTVAVLAPLVAEAAGERPTAMAQGP